jgi:hypothetical protein
VRARGDAWWGGRVAAGLGGESEPDSCWRLGTTLTGGSRLPAKEEGGERELACPGGPWAGCWTGPHGGGKNERGLAGLGRKEGKRKRKKRKKGVGRA